MRVVKRTAGPSDCLGAGLTYPRSKQRPGHAASQLCVPVPVLVVVPSQGGLLLEID